MAERNTRFKYLGTTDDIIGHAFSRAIEARDHLRQDDGRGKRHVEKRMKAWRYYIRRLVTEQPYISKVLQGRISAVDTELKTCTVVVDDDPGIEEDVKYYPPNRPPKVGDRQAIYYQVKLPTKTMDEDSKLEEHERWVKMFPARWLYWVVDTGSQFIIRRQRWPIDPEEDAEAVETIKTITKPVGGYVLHVLAATSLDTRLWLDAFSDPVNPTKLWRIDDWSQIEDERDGSDLLEMTVGVTVPTFPANSASEATPPTGERFFLTAGDHSPYATEVRLVGHWQTREWVRAYVEDVGFGGDWRSSEWEHVPVISSDGVTWTRGTPRLYRPRIRLFDSDANIYFNNVAGNQPLWNETENAWAWTRANGNPLIGYEWRSGTPEPASGQLILDLIPGLPHPDHIIKTPITQSFEWIVGTAPSTPLYPKPFTIPNAPAIWTPFGRTHIGISGNDLIYYATYVNGSQPFPSTEYTYTNHQLYRINLTTGEVPALIRKEIPIQQLVTASWDGQDLIGFNNSGYYYSEDAGDTWEPFEMINSLDFNAITMHGYATLILEGPV